MLTFCRRGTEKRIFELTTKKESSATVTSSYVTAMLCCAEWEPEKSGDSAGALLLIFEYD